METLAWLEETGFSTLMRESGAAFFGTLIFHSLAMGFVVGINVALDLRVLGVASQVRLSMMERFFPVVWYALVVILISGLLLLIAYPAKALTNIVFYIKLSGVVLALLLMRELTNKVLHNPDYDIGRIPGKLKMLAVLSLLMWVVVITSGRLLAYTHHILLANRYY